MALPLLASLNLFGRTALPLIEGGVARGLSAKAINETILSTYGRSLRRSTLLGVVNELKEIHRYGRSLKFINKNRLINVNRLPNALTSLRRRYSFVVAITGEIAETGEKILQRVTVSANSTLTINQIEQFALEMIQNDPTSYAFEVVGALVERGTKSPDLN